MLYNFCVVHASPVNFGREEAGLRGIRAKTIMVLLTSWDLVIGTV